MATPVMGHHWTALLPRPATVPTTQLLTQHSGAVWPCRGGPGTWRLPPPRPSVPWLRSTLPPVPPTAKGRAAELGAAGWLAAGAAGLWGVCRRLPTRWGATGGSAADSPIALAAVAGATATSPGAGDPHPVRYTAPATETELATFLPVVKELVAAAEAAIRPYLFAGAVVERKADMSPVTAADRAAEQAMRTLLGHRCPGHAVLGEEFGATQYDAEYRWVLDPIDGTKAFITNCPLFGTLVAVERWVPEEGRYRPLLGAIHLPVLGQTLVGWWDGCTLLKSDGTSRAVRVRHCDRIEDATVLLTALAPPSDPRQAGVADLAARAGLSRTWGDCFGYFTLATGAADVMVDTGLSYWDVAAVVPVVEGAGGRVTSWTGGDPLQASSLIATAGPLHEAVMAALRPPSPPQG